MNVASLTKDTSIQFGTSGARGLVVDFTPKICAAFAMAFVQQGLCSGKFDLNKHFVAIAIDNRPSSYDMAKHVAAGLAEMGVNFKFYGVLPTPALAFYAMQQGQACIMVTGSHIPFDRNGLKFYFADGEITKQDEQAILALPIQCTQRLFSTELTQSTEAQSTYIDRYLNYFSDLDLTGKRIGVYSHSSAGRDIYLALLKQLGATVIELGRSEVFVPIDTEAVSQHDQQIAAMWASDWELDAIISTDGDGDRPLVADEFGHWLRGDVLGLLVSQCLNIDALSVPINCNSAIEQSGSFQQVVRTKIGSPFVIAEFARLRKQYTAVSGFEANGGYLLASDIINQDKRLSALPTRDAVLPILVILAQLTTQPISHLLDGVAKRFTASGKVEQVPSAIGRTFLAALQSDTSRTLSKLGIAESVSLVDSTDGVRLVLSNQDIVHFRCSGNAPEMRCYVESDSQQNADKLMRALIRRLTTLFSSKLIR